MLEIAGGIILAVIILCTAPFIIAFLIKTWRWIIAILVVGIMAMLHPEIVGGAFIIGLIGFVCFCYFMEIKSFIQSKMK